MSSTLTLKQAKRRANLFLGSALIGFLLTSVLPANAWVLFFKAVSEAALVGALADLFAVTALFKSIPIPILGRHTDVIARNKDRIGENLAIFVEEKFLTRESLLTLMRQHDPIGYLAAWLRQPEHAEKISQLLIRGISTALEVSNDKPIQAFIRRSAHAAIDQIDLAQHGAKLLEQLGKDGRHQELLDMGIEQVRLYLQNEDTRRLLAERISLWLAEEYSWLRKLHLSQTVGEHLSDKLQQLLEALLLEISTSESHEIRQHLDRQFQLLIARLEHDPLWQQRLHHLTQQLKEENAFNNYIASLWQSTRQWLQQDMQKSDSELRRKLTQGFSWAAEQIMAEPALQASLRRHLEKAAYNLAPDFSAFLSKHIVDTVSAWDAKNMSEQIEHNIGKDLQTIRISGTVVGGLLGGIIYGATVLGQQVHTWW